MIAVELDSNKIKRRAYYLWADFIELSCLMDPDGNASLLETLREPWGYETGLAGSFMSDDEAATEFPELDRAEFEDILNVEFLDLVNHFHLREQLLGEHYPFEIDREGLVLSKRPLTDAHRLYVYLLHAANLALHPNASDRNLLTQGFERIAYHALQAMVPSKSIVALFGTAVHGAYKYYTGRKYEKLLAFSADMGTNVDLNITEHTYSDRDSGDDGLDVAAWFPFNDKATHFPLILAQAGCTADENEMLDKQYEVCARRWSQQIRNIWPVEMMLTPQCYRKANGSWPQPAKIVSVFIDRVRLMLLLCGSVRELPHDSLPLFVDAI